MRSVSLALLGAFVLLPVAAGAIPYTLTLEDNVSGGPDTGQPLAPPVVVVHDAGYSIFTLGMPASPGLETLAEEGAPTGVAAEAMASPNVHTVVTGTGPFFTSVSVDFEANPGDLVSVASMFGRTNDLFTGIRNVTLPAMGVMVITPTNVYDAGTEVNTGMAAHIPFYGNSGVGPDENGVVSMISTYSVVDDPTYGMLTWDFPPSATITIVANEPAPVEATSWGGVKNLYR
ncbi:MAG: spondin domain-containing protein [Gemmatimonadetes bacterium]|nr:spondin domain-containing protein [Gemmatimonadota bacterium]